MLNAETKEGRSYGWYFLLKRMANTEELLFRKLPKILSPLPLYNLQNGMPAKVSFGTRRGDHHYVKLSDFKDHLQNIESSYNIHVPLPSKLYPLEASDDNVKEIYDPKFTDCENAFYRKGKFWYVKYRGIVSSQLLKDSKQYRYIIYLLYKKGEPIATDFLLGSVNKLTDDFAPKYEEHDLEISELNIDEDNDTIDNLKEIGNNILQ